MKQKTKRIPANYMDVIFVKSEDHPWLCKEGGIVEIEMENKGFFNAVAQRFFQKPRKSRISLDTYGSALWQQLDGKNTVMQIVEVMINAFPDEKDRMLDRVVHFLSTLEANKFIKRT